MSIFTEEQIAALRAPLAREHVKDRDQGRGKVFYIEGWHAIAEMNRIFGFDGWTRETVMSECCYSGTYEKAVWENGRRTDKTTTSFRCTYRARVRVTVGGVVREGSGHGHGFADNPGEAHESAEKEAETDAMKRALMTFGNPLGLALYDKTQAEVEPAQGRRPAPMGARTATPPPRPPAGQTAQQAGRVAPLPANPEEPPEYGKMRQARALYDRIKRNLETAVSRDGLDLVMEDARGDLLAIEDAASIGNHPQTGEPISGAKAAAALRKLYATRVDAMEEKVA